MTERFMGVGDIARLCGVTQPAVSKWLERHPRTVPMWDSETGIDQAVIVGWRPTPGRKTAWLMFAGGLRHGEARNPDDFEVG